MKRNIATAAAVLLYLCVHAMAQDRLSGDERAEFLTTFQGECLETQKKAPENAGLSETLLTGYCVCMSEEMAERLTRAEVLAGPENLPDAQVRSDAATKICHAKVMQSTPLDEQRKIWMANVRQGCLNGHEKDPDKERVGLARATAYCDCVSADIAKDMTFEMANGPMSPEFKTLIDATARTCSAKFPRP